MVTPSYSAEKMQAAIMFFCLRITNGTLGRTKMAKLLYFLDFDHYEQHDTPVTGATYIHKLRGPYPREMRAEIKKLAGQVNETDTMVGPYQQYALSLHDGALPNFQVFSVSELEALLKVADTWEHQSANEIAAASHGEEPWIATGDNEVIPYAYAHYRRKYEPQPDDDEQPAQALVSVD